MMNQTKYVHCLTRAIARTRSSSDQLLLSIEWTLKNDVGHTHLVLLIVWLHCAIAAGLNNG